MREKLFTLMVFISLSHFCLCASLMVRWDIHCECVSPWGHPQLFGLHKRGSDCSRLWQWHTLDVTAVHSPRLSRSTLSSLSFTLTFKHTTNCLALCAPVFYHLRKCGVIAHSWLSYWTLHQPIPLLNNVFNKQFLTKSLLL